MTSERFIIWIMGLIIGSLVGGPIGLAVAVWLLWQIFDGLDGE